MLPRLPHAILLACLVGPAGCEPTRPEPPPAAKRAVAAALADEADAPEPPRLVVLLVVDQLPSWRFQQDLPHLGGGIARLVRGGSYYPYAELPYASTFTAPGHASIATGAPPAVHGILANSWYRRDLGQVQDATEDPAFPVLRLQGGNARGSAAPTELQVEGIADALRRAHPGGRSIAVGLKARASVLVLGRRPDLSVFYDSDQVAFTTSRYYADAPPAWLRALAEDAPIAARLDTRWEPLDAALLERELGPDDGAGEGSFFGLDATFPHDLGASGAPAAALLATPLGHALTLETALAAVEGEELGADDVPDVLAISLSAHDYAGHVWGQESWERLDLLLRLDQQLGDFLDALDARVGEGRYAVVLTSDHGATPLVERSVAAGEAAHRCEIDQLLAAARTAASDVLGDGDWVLGTWGNTVYLSDAFHRMPEALRSVALEAIVDGLSLVEGVGFTASTSDILGDCDQRATPLERLACRSLRAGESGEIFCAMGSLSVPKADYATGTAHGSPNDEDRVVPIAVYGPGIAPRVDPRAVSLLQVAPTVTELLGAPPPAAAEDEPLD